MSFLKSAQKYRSLCVLFAVFIYYKTAFSPDILDTYYVLQPEIVSILWHIPSEWSTVQKSQ